MGRSFPGWALCLWGLALALRRDPGGGLLRRKLIVDEALPFPTGIATAELIETIFAARASAVRRARSCWAARWSRWTSPGSATGGPQLIPPDDCLGGADRRACRCAR